MRYERQQLPSALLDCAPQPLVPAIASQRQVGGYILDLVEAGADCRSKLGRVKALVTPPAGS